MLIVNKNSQRKHNNKFLFSKIIKLKIPKPSKLKQNQEEHSLNQLGKRQLSIVQRMTINKMVQSFQCPVQHKSKDKEPRYSKLLKTRRTIQRSNTRNEIGIKPLGIKKLKNNFTTKTIDYDQKEQKENNESETKRSQSLQHIFNNDYSSARFFNKSVGRQNGMVKKDSASSVYSPRAGLINDFQFKMLPFIKRVSTFERTTDKKKYKNTHYTFRREQIMYSQIYRPDSKIEIKGWQRQISILDEDENDYRIQDKNSSH